MTVLYLDIETIPTQRQDVCEFLEESLRDELQVALDSVCAPANYKDAEKIAEYCAGKRASLQAEFLDKLKGKIESTGLDGSFGQVFCIGWAFDDGGVSAIRDMSEAKVLRAFSSECKVAPSESFTVCVVGHNVLAFDLRFLAQRYIVHGIRPPLAITRAAQAKPWESDRVFDTMVQWAGVGQKIGLSKLCMALSIPNPKSEIDGSMVWPMVQAGKFDEVANYCMSDVEAVRSIHKRMTFQQWPALAEAA